MTKSPRPEFHRKDAVDIRGRRPSRVSIAEPRDSEEDAIPKIVLNKADSDSFNDDPPTPQSVKSPTSLSGNPSVSLTSPMSTTASLAARAMQTLRLRKSASRRDTVTSRDVDRRIHRQRTRARLFHPKEVIGCDPWATWLLGISAVVFLLCTICLCLAFCNDGGFNEAILAELEHSKTLHKYEKARAGNFEKLLFETFEIIGIKVDHDVWDDDADPKTIKTQRQGQLWRELHKEINPKDRTKGLYRDGTVKASKRIRAIVKDLPKMKIMEELKTYPEGPKSFKYPQIHIPVFSDENNKYHRMANVAMLQRALTMVKKQMNLYSERTARYRLNLTSECETHPNLLSLVEEVRDKIPIDKSDYWHYARVGGNLISQATQGTWNMVASPITSLTCGATQCCYNHLDQDATRVKFGKGHRKTQNRPEKQVAPEIPEEATRDEKLGPKDKSEA